MKATLLAEHLAVEHALDEVQSRYLVELANETLGLSNSQTNKFLAESAEVLSERPPQQWDALTEALSMPHSFAVTWREENRPPESHELPTLTDKLRRPRTLASLAIFLLVTVGATWTFRYYTATPEFDTPCTGAQAVEVEVLEAAGATEFRMPLVVDRRYGINICLQAFDGADDEGRIPADVIFDRVYLSEPLSLAVQPVGWEIVEDGEMTGNASSNSSSSVSDQHWLNLVVWFEGDRCNIEGGTGFGSLSVDYTYRGRQRTGLVDLGAQYSFWAQGVCTAEVRAAEASRDAAWQSVVGTHFFPRTVGSEPLDEQGHLTLGSVDLQPLAVSRDLCRYLRGIDAPQSYTIEPLAERAVFQAAPDDAAVLIDGAVLGVCPEFADQRAALLELLNAEQTAG